MQHCKREYCNAGTRQWSQRGIYIRKASKAKNSEQIIIRSNDSRYRGYPKTEKNAIQQRVLVVTAIIVCLRTSILGACRFFQFS